MALARMFEDEMEQEFLRDFDEEDGLSTGNVSAPPLSTGARPRDTSTGQRPNPTGPYNPDPVDEPAVPPASPSGSGTAAWSTQLLEGDPSKFTAEHIANSPKYQFLDLAQSNKYNYNQYDQLLGELKQTHGDFWQGWEADGKGNLVFRGDPNQLHDRWEGATFVDAVQGFGAGGEGWRWGVENPASLAAAAQGGSGAPITMSGGTGANIAGVGGGGGNVGGGGNSSTNLEALIQRLITQQDEDKAARDAFRNNMRGTITRRMDLAQQPVDPNDPIIADQMRAFRGNQERYTQQQREALAERGAAEGMGTGAFDAAVQSSFENMGNAAASHQSGLLGERYAQKLDELKHLLAVGAGVLTQQEQLALESSIAALQGRLREMDISQAGNIASMGNATDNRRIDLGYDQLGFQIGQHASNLDQELMNMILGR